MRSNLCILIFALALLFGRSSQAEVTALYQSATDVPVTASSYTAAGESVSFILNFAPPVGTTLVVVKNTGISFITGTFNNLSQGQVVTLTYAGIHYRFLANYYGGTGNDLVLQWANTRPVAWGYNVDGQLGDRSLLNRANPVNVFSMGILANRSVLSMAAGQNHSLAVCSDGSAVAWGNGNLGRLGAINTSGGSATPILVNATGVLAGETVVQVAAGNLHSMALCSDGTVATWGRNDFGILGVGTLSTTSSDVPVAVVRTGALAGKDVVAVAAGALYNLALCSDGTVVAWGYNGTGQLGDGTTINRLEPVAVNTSGVLAGKKVIAISAGAGHSLALCSDGALVAWGSGGFGQLGNNSSSDSTLPVAVNMAGVLAGKTVVAIFAGLEHCLALCSDGKVVAWGHNSHGQLGNNSTADSLVPVLVNTAGALAGKQVASISAGNSHSLALCSDGTLVAWGDPEAGAFASGTFSDSLVPVNCTMPASGERYLAAFSGSQAFHSLGLVAAPQLLVVGGQRAGSLTQSSATLSGFVNPVGNTTTARFEYGLTVGYGSMAAVTLAPDDGLSAQTVAATVGGLAPGTVYHYRLTATNAFGTMSTKDGIFATSISVVANFDSATTVPVSASQFSAAGETFNSTLNFAPPTGTTLTVVNNTGPAPIFGTFTNLAQGQMVTLTHDGISYPFIANYFGGTGNDLVLQWARTRPVAWGSNQTGKLGDNSLVNRLVPVEVPSTGALADKTVISAAVGQNRSVAVCTDGTVAQWGNGTIVPMVMSPVGALAGRKVVAVSIGETHVVALCSDGAVVAWGSNTNGELGNNSLVDSETPVLVNAGALAGQTVSAVAAGGRFSLALRSDGTVVAWGAGFFGQLGCDTSASSLVPVAVNTAGVLGGKTVVAIAAGYDHSVAVTADGIVVTWWDPLESTCRHASLSIL